jgi:hypothetical protein
MQDGNQSIGIEEHYYLILKKYSLIIRTETGGISYVDEYF